MKKSRKIETIFEVSSTNGKNFANEDVKRHFSEKLKLLKKKEMTIFLNIRQTMFDVK